MVMWFVFENLISDDFLEPTTTKKGNNSQGRNDSIVKMVFESFLSFFFLAREHSWA